MMDRMSNFELPGKPGYWIAAGVLCALTGLGLDLANTGVLMGEPAKWGGFGALIGAGVGLMAVFSRKTGQQ